MPFLRIVMSVLSAYKVSLQRSVSDVDWLSSKPFNFVILSEHKIYWGKSRGCFGCFTKRTLITAVDEPSKGLRIQGRTVKKPSIDDFWSSSTGEMDNNAVQSSTMSSISASNQSLDPVNGAGLLLWNQTRQQWLANKSSQNRKQVLEPTIRYDSTTVFRSWNASYESLLGTSKPFPQPVPLPEMVDFLVDVWEQEGLYD
ncbi:hypothetical protein Pint_12391 [Pistacia integerrima]|uniref:Uncharacterized protein n=1 Tax=Pistacia integerrima TaxID=434235 RepID=A0ACC0Y9V5_9ROSI|nr:hypothetical protein Pint_12391 [Pistacia integerrima]